MKFPKYSNFDYVQANYRLLKDGLGVEKVKLSTGASVGAIQSCL
jgi:homoserine acetyltransferase